MPRPRSSRNGTSSLAENFAELRQSYDMAKSSRYRRKRTGVVATGSGADYHYQGNEYFAGIELARDLFRNTLVAQGIRRLVANVVQDGFSVDPQTGDDGANAEISARWKDWANDPEQVDRAGELSFHAIEKLVLQLRVVDGDLVLLPLREGSLQLHEAHRLRSPSNARLQRAGRTALIHGVLIDQFRRRLQYWLTNDDIEPRRSITKVGEITKYDARDADGHKQVFHIYDPDRVSQTRGVTAMAPIADTAGMGEDLFFAQLIKAQVSSCWTILHEMAAEANLGVPDKQHGERTEETRPDGTTRVVEGVSPGMEIFGYPGEKLVGFSPNVPNPEFFEHATLILTFIAINLDLPLAVFLLDPTKTNFSGWRGAMDQAKLRFRAMQRWLIDFFHRPVYRWKLRQWIADDPALGLIARRQGEEFFAHKWNPPGWPYIEPLKDGLADKNRFDEALISRRRWAAERGFESWERLAGEIVEDNGLFIELAQKKAEKLNKEFPGLGLTWRELISLPTVDTVSAKMALQTAGEPDQGDEQEKKEARDAA